MGIKSPITGINLIKLIAVDLLFLVMKYNKVVVKPLNTSPINGISNRGAPM